MEHVIVFELGRGRSRHFIHTTCVDFPYKNYRGETVTRADWDDAQRVIPKPDAADMTCTICRKALA